MTISLEDLKDWMFEVPPGWHQLVQKLVQDIIATNPSDELVILQIKEKFGGLRFYVGVASDEVFNLIDIAEQESYKICQDCGTRKEVTTCGSAWFRTVCSTCKEKYPS